MKEFDINIKETLERIVTVTAENREAAEDIVRNRYDSSQIILDAEDFTGVDFSCKDERDIVQEQGDMIDVLLIKPFMYPQKITIGCELEDLQKAVGGSIEAVYPFNDPVAIICNEEGKINGSELNRTLRNENGEVYDILAGDFLITGLTEDDFGSLSPELMKKYEEQFHQPEMYVRFGRGIMPLPVPEDKIRKSDAPEKSDMISKKVTHDRETL